MQPCRCRCRRTGVEKERGAADDGEEATGKTHGVVAHPTWVPGRGPGPGLIRAGIGPGPNKVQAEKDKINCKATLIFV